jgi:hypothetical protein
MKDLFKVKYQIIDRGIQYPEDHMVVTVNKGGDVFESLKGTLNRNRKAMDLSAKFLVNIIEQEHAGWVK